MARDLPRFQGDDDALRRWVFSIAHNRLLDSRRREARRPRRADRAVPEVAVLPAPDPFDPELVAALAHLTPEQREVVVLRFVADLALEDVARVVGRRVGAVKALQHRGLDALARLMVPPPAPPEPPPPEPAPPEPAPPEPVAETPRRARVSEARRSPRSPQPSSSRAGMGAPPVS